MKVGIFEPNLALYLRRLCKLVYAFTVHVDLVDRDLNFQVFFTQRSLFIYFDLTTKVVFPDPYQMY